MLRLSRKSSNRRQGNSLVKMSAIWYCTDKAHEVLEHHRNQIVRKINDTNIVAIDDAGCGELTMNFS